MGQQQSKQNLMHEFKQDQFTFNLKDILINSFYYPACGFDGSMVKNFRDKVNSFIYVDAAPTREEFDDALRDYPFKGCHIIHQETLEYHQVLPNIKDFKIPAKIITMGVSTEPFCEWIIFEDEQQNRFSFLYIVAEATAAYDELYNKNKIKPYAVAFRRVDGFSLNKIKFLTPDFRGHILFEDVMMSQGMNPMYFISSKEHAYKNYQTKIGSLYDLSIYQSNI